MEKCSNKSNKTKFTLWQFIWNGDRLKCSAGWRSFSPIFIQFWGKFVLFVLFYRIFIQNFNIKRLKFQQNRLKFHLSPSNFINSSLIFRLVVIKFPTKRPENDYTMITTKKAFVSIMQKLKLLKGERLIRIFSLYSHFFR